MKEIHNLYSLDNDCFIYIDLLAEGNGYSIYYFDQDRNLIDGGELIIDEDNPVETENAAIDACLNFMVDPSIGLSHSNAELVRKSVFLGDLEEMGFKGF